MSHNYHEGLPGFHPDQLLHDGCDECEQRGADTLAALAHMDRVTFRKAWDRALAFEARTIDNVSDAEVQVLRVLAAVRFMLAHE